MAIERSFQDISEGSLSEADQQSYLVALGWSRAKGWDDLLRSKRVLIVSEAGAGKTYECQTQCRKLWDAGEPAFFLDLATLARGELRDMLSREEEHRLDAWLISQSDIATFFLDSIDELELTQGSFGRALKRFAKSAAEQLGRMRVVITTRPIPVDQQLVRSLLPVPENVEVEFCGASFAQVAIHGVSSGDENSKEKISDWRTVALMPLSDAQILEFSRSQNVADPESMFEDLRKRNAQEFARRPQDLIELCSDWRYFNRIRTHRNQVESNVLIKLKPSKKRREPAELSIEKAIEGASRLALAMMITRRLTIRHDAEADTAGEDAPLDPEAILSDWNPDERKALLERPLFGFASYGRVRFHHRSVAEYLAAERLKDLRKRGMTFRSLKRLIFAETRGKIIVRPSKRPVAGWLALSEVGVFEMLRDHEPAVLLVHGDPESLEPGKRQQALRAYVNRYGSGGWRWLSVPPIQIHRFASSELAEEIKSLWTKGIQNSEVREILLDLVSAGRIDECRDIAHEVAIDSAATTGERLSALDGLAAMNDPRMESVTTGMTNKVDLWPDRLALAAVSRIFPKHLTPSRLCQVLARTKTRNERLHDFGWQIPWMIEHAELNEAGLEELRDGFAGLASTRLRWQEGWPHIVSDRSEFGHPLAITCVKGLKSGASEQWLRAAFLALCLPRNHSGDGASCSELGNILHGLSAENNAKLFWNADEIIRSINPGADARARISQITFFGPVKLDYGRDFGWIKEALADRGRSSVDRSLLFQAAIGIYPSKEEWDEHVRGLKPLLCDQPDLIKLVNKFLKPPRPNKRLKRWEIESAKHREKEERETARNLTSWADFWTEVAERPESAFSPEKSGSTAWNLWRAMRNAGKDSRRSGWNRRFIESYFDKETADRLRLTLMRQWRTEFPTLTSERPAEAKNTYLVIWELGLAAVYAEAEDPDWAKKLSHDEALLASRYAPMELNGLPLWVDSLITAHPEAVKATLGKELRNELDRIASTNGYSMLLQSIDHAPKAVIDLFLPILVDWLRNGKMINKGGGAPQRLAQVIGFLIEHGNEGDHSYLADKAQKCLRGRTSEIFAKVWLPTLMRLDAASGVAILEERIKRVQQAKFSKAVHWFAELFGDRHDSANLAHPRFTPEILLRLLRMAYHHVDPVHDVVHHGAYSPDVRDNAERARSMIVDALLKTKGEEGWDVKLQMAADPLCAHFKDRIIAVAEEHWAEEIDGVAFTEAQAIQLDSSYEGPPVSNEAMFSIMVDRLHELDDLLLQDVSPREGWSAFKKERIMRRAIANELRHLANGMYKIDQESVTADEKETDIRLRSTSSPHEAVIELKLADGRTAGDLLDTLRSQIVAKYMASESSRSGCLLITLAKNRSWIQPGDGSKLNFEGLVELLCDEAKRIVEEVGGSMNLHVHAFDLRPRLRTEVTTAKTKRARKGTTAAKGASKKAVKAVKSTKTKTPTNAKKAPGLKGQ